MLAEVNEWGYELLQKPLVFTFSTLFLRNNPAVHKNDIFNLSKYLIMQWIAI